VGAAVGAVVREAVGAALGESMGTAVRQAVGTGNSRYSNSRPTTGATEGLAENAGARLAAAIEGTTASAGQSNEHRNGYRDKSLLK
jgi:hypothetical protein